MAGYLGRTAAEIARAVRAGEATAREVVGEHLGHIAATDPRIGAFRSVRRDQALAEATALDSRPDRYALPLAGVPVAIKDNIAVSGEFTGSGSRATATDPQLRDHEIARRLRAAGAIVVGITRMPELGIFPTTDDPDTITRNPWSPDRTPGGSSGGSAAAVASGMVPVAHGTDGMGSIRIPAACCGLVGLKPGRGVVPSQLAGESWYGLSENGVLATTPEDAELVFAVLAGLPTGQRLAAPGRLRIAVSRRSPIPVVRADADARAALSRAARALVAQGHSARIDDPRYSPATAAAGLSHWFAGAASAVDSDALDLAALQPRSRSHVRIGRIGAVRGMVRPGAKDRWRADMEAFFTEHDVLLMPVLATSPLPADPWSSRSWLRNIAASARFAPYAAAWNVAGLPAMSVPAGVRSDGLPAAVQVVAGPGGEHLLLAIARQIAARIPWQRTPNGWIPEQELPAESAA
ncbi:MAG: amidase [Cryptosporangiaceae bacterium]|nr:amidase [Cryptosporangiaceae bacterium]